MKKSFSKNMMAMCVAALFVAPSAFAADVVCDTPTGCNYKSTFGGTAWKINNDDNNLIQEPNLNLTLKAQTYQNTPLSAATSANEEPLIYMMGDESSTTANAKLHIPTGTNIVLENQPQDRSAVVFNNAQATIEQGVTVHIKPTHAQKTSTTPHQDGDYSEAGTAIAAYNDSPTHTVTMLNTSANITLDAAASNGLGGAGLAKIHASNHSITMNQPFTIGITAMDGANIQANNVTVQGNGRFQIGLESTSDEDYGNDQTQSQITLNQSSVKLSGNEFNMGMIASDGTINLNNKSSVSAQHGIIIAAADGNNSPSTINVNDSTIIGSGSLLSVSPKEIRDIWQRDGDKIVVIRSDVTVNANNGTLIGKTVLDSDLRKAGEPHGKINFNLTNNSIWTIQNSSEIDNLKLNNATVKIGKDNGFNELKINGNLSGNGAFHMNSDIAGNQADLLNVTGAVSGSHTLHIANTATEPQSTDGKLTVVKTGSSGADAFKLGNAKGVVEAGKYLYALQKNGNDWQLVYDSTTQPVNQTQPTQPVTPTQPTQPTNPTTPVQPTTPTQPSTPAQPNNPVVPVTPVVPTTPTTPTAPVVDKNFRYDLAGSLAHAQTAVLSAQAQNQALNEKQLALHQNQRLHGLWLQGETSHTKRKNSQVNGGNLSGFKDKTNTWQIGYDKEMGNGYAGVLAGQIRHNVDYHIDLYENSKIRGNTFAVYGGLHGTSGWFVDGTLRHTRYSADNPQFERDRFRINSLNVQGGKNIALNETWTMIPNAAVTIGRLSGSQFMQDGNLLQTQAGFDLQGKFALQHGVLLQPKVGAYYAGDHRGVDVAFNGENFRADHSGSRFAAKLGADVSFNKNNVLSANFRTEHGSKIKRPYQVDVGFRRSW